MLLCTQSVDINMSRIETCQSGSSAQYINCMAIKVPLNRTMITQYIETPCLEIWWHRTRWKRSNCWHILGDFHTHLPFRVNTIELTTAMSISLIEICLASLLLDILFIVTCLCLLRILESIPCPFAVQANCRCVFFFTSSAESFTLFLERNFSFNPFDWIKQCLKFN